MIPKDIRHECGIKSGMLLEVRWEKDAIAITPAPLPVKLERKGRLLVAVPTEGTPRLSGGDGRTNPKSTAQRTVGEPRKHGARFSSGYKLHDCGGMLMA